MTDDQPKNFFKSLKTRILESLKKPLIVSVMGQTGVGKSSLINALFKTQLETSAVAPCTKAVEKVAIKNEDGHELWFFDMPGLGESKNADDKYIEEYQKKLIESDVILWAIHVDNRSVSFDSQAMHELLNRYTKEEQQRIAGKLTFVLTKADLIAPPPWIYLRLTNSGMFIPDKNNLILLKQKSEYIQRLLLSPLGKVLKARTYNDIKFSIRDPSFSVNENDVYYHGYMTEQELRELNTRYPEFADVFKRLYNSYKVVPCSSRFRYNLHQVMLVIVGKLEIEAMGRFNNFVSEEQMSNISFSEARRFCNIAIYDKHKEKMVFDLAANNFIEKR
jgi:GTP-binding protein EngB required for normal cell division